MRHQFINYYKYHIFFCHKICFGRNQKEETKLHQTITDYRIEKVQTRSIYISTCEPIESKGIKNAMY